MGKGVRCDSSRRNLVRDKLFESLTLISSSVSFTYSFGRNEITTVNFAPAATFASSDIHRVKAQLAEGVREFDPRRDQTSLKRFPKIDRNVGERSRLRRSKTAADPLIFDAA